ncbi:hypothetical protein S83_070082, partial [Arachis hypogaea]
MRARARDQRVRGGHRRNAAAAAAIAVVEEGVRRRERERRFADEMEREDEDATRERRRLFRRALSSLLGSIEAAAAARACRAPVLTFGFYDYFLRFIGAVFDAKGADAILSFEKFCCNLPRPLLQVPPFWQPHNRAVARRIQNMGWRADGGLWLLVRGGGLYLRKGTGLTEEFEEVPVQSRGFDSSKHNKELKDQASDVGVLLADTDGIFHSIK